ncbi:hypothetical protein BD324DRAFT_577826 [Kockovaella imperatae]|uniref:Small RNA 2'-O-methyltransferase n=1 Tax=Kockovaella imperatae TaxID=4999 RepID=A0A1Y1UKZ1_9TREE|nr:hypothetical protein BD324DRAFT_577826 [Kockovaella imperatae]ORX38723.1 hypothetical protein BD324DRAFT_577826 [Kockovaella imperatae]
MPSDIPERQGTPGTPPKLSPSTLPAAADLEVSKVEEEDVTGVVFSPELWMQRRSWAMDVLRNEGVRSVLDIGCGPGALLETLVVPPSSVYEEPIRSLAKAKGSHLPSPVDSLDELAEGSELFIDRLAALDPSPSYMPPALSIMSTPPSPTSSFSPAAQPRWEPLHTELWLGGIEKYNARLEGYEAITCLEVIEHLDPNVLSRFGVVTMGTYRPRLLLVTTPNFDFNAKFPRAADHDFAKVGFMDPTGRTERVFRHSDHKLEMTSGEFREWATSAAADWGYDVELGGVGISNKPSYYPADDPHLPNQPIYATQTAIFRLEALPARSPRSVRSSQLPFMPGSKESSHSHKLAGKFVHPPTVEAKTKLLPEQVVDMVKETLAQWNVGQVSIGELWARSDISLACAGSKRYFVSCLGGWGDCPPARQGGAGECEVYNERGQGLSVRWKSFQPVTTERHQSWGSEQRELEGPSEKTGGW